MTRIVAGQAKGRQLAVPKSGTRPTAERVRESLFSRLEHWGYIDDAIVADLFAGSGALGLEAASRGASSVVCVEAAASAARVLMQNIAATGLRCVTAINKKVDTYLAGESGILPIFDLAILDPPYDYSDQALARTLELLAAHIADDGLIVVERDKKSPEPQWPEAFALMDDRTMGDTRLWSAQRTLDQ